MVTGTVSLDGDRDPRAETSPVYPSWLDPQDLEQARHLAALGNSPQDKCIGAGTPSGFPRVMPIGKPLPLSLGRTCDLLLVNRIWQKVRGCHSLIRCRYLRLHLSRLGGDSCWP